MLLKKLINIFYTIFPLIVGSIIGILISNNIDYSLINRPPLSPPGFLFPIIWTIIYILMGISYNLYKKNYKDKSIIDVIYYIQLFVNAFWSIIFFTLKLRLFSILWIIILDILVITLIIAFFKKNRISAYLNLLYLVWILFATYLTIGVYLLN